MTKPTDDDPVQVFWSYISKPNLEATEEGPDDAYQETSSDINEAYVFRLPEHQNYLHALLSDIMPAVGDMPEAGGGFVAGFEIIYLDFERPSATLSIVDRPQPLSSRTI